MLIKKLAKPTLLGLCVAIVARWDTSHCHIRKIKVQGWTRPPITTIHVIMLVKMIKHNLHQLCEGDTIVLNKFGCIIEHKGSKKYMFKGCRFENVDNLDLDNVSNNGTNGTKCLATHSEDWLDYQK